MISMEGLKHLMGTENGPGFPGNSSVTEEHPITQIVLALHQGHVCIWIVPLAHLRRGRQLLLWNLKMVLARTHYCPVHGLLVMSSALPDQLNSYQLNINKTSDANVASNKGLWGHSTSCIVIIQPILYNFWDCLSNSCLPCSFQISFSFFPWVKTVVLSNIHKKRVPDTSTCLPDNLITF